MPKRGANLSISLPTIKIHSASSSSSNDEDAAEKGTFLLLPPHAESTALPSPLLKHAQEVELRKTSLWQRISARFSRRTVILTLLVTTFLLYRCIMLVSTAATFHLPRIQNDYALIEGSTLPQAPEPVVLQDHKGKKRWTIYIPDNQQFPLRPDQYRDICSKAKGASESIARSKPASLPGRLKLGKNYDANYMDVADAAACGAIPTSSQFSIDPVGNDDSAASSVPVCEKSLTFLLETEEAGFGKSLLALWLAYGLAQREKRAFFIDDSRWQYGRYLSFFPTPPRQSCRPPPPSHIVPCPHQARHLAVSAATIDDLLPTILNELSVSARTNQKSQKGIYRMARAGHEALFQLIGDDASYSVHRIATIQDRARALSAPIIGMHIRRGDRHPLEYQYHNDYLPLERFVTSALEPLAVSSGNTTSPFSLLIASDDPDIPSSPDFHSLNTTAKLPFRLERAQDRIVLASKNTMPPPTPDANDGSAFVKYVEQPDGWEGGFFASLFRSLGKPSHPGHLTFSSAREHRIQVEERLQQQQQQRVAQDGTAAGAAGGGVVREVSAEEQKAEDHARAMRELVGRGYLLDLEVLGRGSDRVVCAVSSATCRVLGVMMGWEKVRSGAWANVDDGRGWSWDGSQ